MGARLRSGLVGAVLLGLLTGCASGADDRGEASTSPPLVVVSSGPASAASDGAAVSDGPRSSASSRPTESGGSGSSVATTVGGTGSAAAAPQAAPAVPLLGTTWWFTSRVVNGLGTAQPADPDAWVRFGAGTVTFHRTVDRGMAAQDTDCPTWTARVDVTGGQVQLLQPERDENSRLGCGTRFLAYGATRASVQVTGRTLTVGWDDWGNQQTLVFSADRPSPPPVGSPDLSILPPASSPTVRQEIESDPLRGKHFRAVSGPGYQPVGDGVTLDFGNDTFGVTTGCNGVTADYTITRPGVVRFSGGLMTLKACNEPLMAQENWAVTTISGSRAFAFDGTTLRIARRDGEAVFRVTDAATGHPADDGIFLGAVDEIVDATGHRRLPTLQPRAFIGTGVSIGLREGRLVVDTGCGQQLSLLSGRLPRVTAGVADGPVLRGCPALRSDLRELLRSILSGPLTVQRDAGGFLTITGRDGLQVTAHSGSTGG